jgi:Family of unknown function (DUF5681)
MSDYKIGYGKPPKDSRFKAGNNANPKGRPRRKPLALAKIMQDFEGQLSRYTESGRTKTARRRDLISKKIVNDAVKGDVKSAEMLLSLLQHLMKKNADAGSSTIRIRNWLPDRPGQTAEQKTQESTTDGAADPPEWWRKAEDDPEQDGS